MFSWVVTNKHVIMKNLKSKYPDQFDWLYPVPGDWHIMKTAAEVIKFVLNDGGFKLKSLLSQGGHHSVARHS